MDMAKQKFLKRFYALVWVLIALFFYSAPVPEAESAEKVTLFIVSEWFDRVDVYRGEIPVLKRVDSIKVGRNPHNLGISPDGRWVVTGDRLAKQVSVIDTRTLKRVAVLPTGKHPHDLVFSSDSKVLYVGHERETYIGAFETGTWKKRPPIEVGFAQHDLTISPDDRELWWTVTHRAYKKGEPRIGIVNLADLTKKVEMIDNGGNAHDVIFSPDGGTVWVTNGGFIGRPEPIIHYMDPKTRRVLGQISPGKYPFHSPKRGRDGSYLRKDAKEMWFSDRGIRALIAVDLKSRKVVATVPVGKGSFHITITPKGILFVANHDSNTVSIVDSAQRKLIGTLPVRKHPHGLAVLVGP